MELRTLIEEYLNAAKLMQVATVAGDQPWCASVGYALDEEWNLYWISLPQARHSQELVANPKIAGAIADEKLYVEGPRGLQFEGIAELVPDEEVEANLSLYCKRLNRDMSLIKDIQTGKNPHKLYRIKPSRFVLFDRVNFPHNERQVLELN